MTRLAAVPNPRKAACLGGKAHWALAGAVKASVRIAGNALSSDNTVLPFAKDLHALESISCMIREATFGL